MVRSNKTDMTSLGQAWAIGMDLVIYLIAGGLIGYGLDALFKTGPWLMLIMALLGLASGLLRFIRDALKLNREMAAKAGRARRGDGPSE